MTQRAVSNGIINYLSASQISKFDPEQEGGCNRRWYFDKVLGFPEPSTKSQALGTQVHAEIEAYLKTGVKNLGKTALAGFDFLPTPGSVLVEHSLEGFTIAGIKIKGFIDALNESKEYIDESGQIKQLADCTTEIIDWKTASDLKSKGPGSELINTIQMALYGKYARSRSEDLEFVRLSHVYFSTRGAAQSIKRTHLFSVDKIEERYQGISKTVESMKVAATAQGVEDLTPNLNACRAFHRECIYARHCPRNVTNIFDLGIEKGEETMGLFDKVSKAPASLSEAKTAPTETPKPLTNGATPVTVKEILANPGPQKEIPLVTTIKTSPDLEAEITKVQAELLAEEQRALNAFGVDTSVTFQSIVPPDAKPSEGPGTFDPEPVEKVKTPRKKKEPVTEAPKVPESDQKALDTFTKYLKKEMTPQELTAYVNGITPEVSNDCAEHPVFVGPKEGLFSEDNFQKFNLEETENRVIKDLQSQPLELYINVTIRGLQTKDLQTEINRALKVLEQDFGVTDIRLGTGLLAYGGWRGALASELKSYNLTGRYSINGNGDFISVAIEALEQQNAVTVKGV